MDGSTPINEENVVNAIQELLYTPLEYIQTNRSTYLDTEFKPNNDTRAILDADFLTSAYPAWTFGARNATGSSVDSFSFCRLSSTAFRSDYNRSGVQISTNQITGRHLIDKNKNITYIDNVQKAVTTYASFQANHNLLLFSVNNNGASDSRREVLKLYSFKLYDNEILIRDYIPCKRSDTNQITLYDKVNHKFCKVATGTLTGGPSIFPEYSSTKNATVSFLGKALGYDIDATNSKILNAQTFKEVLNQLIPS